jgi:hypothetical protein
MLPPGRRFDPVSQSAFLRVLAFIYKIPLVETGEVEK